MTSWTNTSLGGAPRRSFSGSSDSATASSSPVRLPVTYSWALVMQDRPLRRGTRNASRASVGFLPGKGQQHDQVSHDARVKIQLAAIVGTLKVFQAHAQLAPCPVV